MPNTKPRKAKRKQQTDPTEYFSTLLTKPQAKQQARLQARLATRDAARELRGESRAAKLTTKRDQGYFDEYAATIPQAAQKAAEATQTALGQIGSTAQTSAAYAEQIRQRLADEGRADAALRGATYDPSQDSTAAQAALSRLDSSGILSNVTAAQGASTQGLYANRANITEREALEQRLRDQARHRSINADKRDLAAKKGDLAKSSFADIVERERNYELGQQAAQLNAKGQRVDAKLERSSQRQDARADRIRERLQAQSQAETQRHNLASEQNASATQRRLRRAARADRRQERRSERRDQRADQRENAQEHRQQTQQALALIRTSPKDVEGKSVEQIADLVMASDKTISRASAVAAARRYVRQHTVEQVGAAIAGG